VFHVSDSQYKDGFLLALLNSWLLARQYWAGDVAAQKDDFRQATLEGLRSLPIRRVLFTTPASDKREELKTLGKSYRKQEGGFREVLSRIDCLLPQNAEGKFAAFADSIAVGEAQEKGYIDGMPDYLDKDAPSGYDPDGNPLEHSDVVHDFLAYLAEHMMEMHREKQALWDKIRSGLLNKGVDPGDISSLSVTGSIRDYVANARESTGPTAKQRRMRTYAEQAEGAFGCSLDELHERDEHNYEFEDLPRLGFERFKWLAALRGANPSLLDDVRDAVDADVKVLRGVLERIGSGDWYPKRDPDTGQYDVEHIRSTDWLIDQIVYRLYGLSEEEIRVVEGLI
jgi:hypothetical protein